MVKHISFRRQIIASAAFLILIYFFGMLLPVPSQDLNYAITTPTRDHWFGTDFLGRDLLYRVCTGARISLGVAIVSSVFSMFIGLFAGFVSAWFGGWIDFIFTRIIDMFYAFPALLVALFLSAIFGSGLMVIILTTVCFGWMDQARLVRAQTMQIKKQLYIESAKAMGLTSSRILLRHILPAIFGPSLVIFIAQVPMNIVTESTLSFLGVGLQPPLASLGSLTNEGAKALTSYPHLLLFPSATILIIVLACEVLRVNLKKSH